MPVKPTFIVRDHLNKAPSESFDPNKLIQYYKSLHPSYKVIPNSPLYLMAVAQYNKQIKISKTRPSIPDWFCGHINPEDGALITNPTDAQLRALAGVTTNVIEDTEGIVSESGQYAIDTCLIRGTPGSTTYTACQEEESPDVFETSGVDWVGSLAAEEAAVDNSLDGGIGGGAGGCGDADYCVDAGEEVYTKIGDFEFRLDVNDSKPGLGCSGEFYFLDASVATAEGALQIDVAGDVATITAKSFTSKRSGYKYTFRGIQVGRSNGVDDRFDAQPTYRITKAELDATGGNVIRIHWCASK